LTGGAELLVRLLGPARMEAGAGRYKTNNREDRQTGIAFGAAFAATAWNVMDR